MDYVYKSTVGGAEYASTLEAVERSVAVHGFSVSSVYDVHLTLAAKGFAISPLRIYEIERDAVAGEGPDARLKLLMPCRVNVAVEDEGVAVAAILPSIMCRVFPEAELEDVAAELETRVIAIVDEAIALVARGAAV